MSEFNIDLLKYDFSKECSESKLGGGKGEGLPCLFFEIKKSALTLRISKRKNSNIFPCGALFLDFWIKRLSKCPNFMKPPRS